MPAYIVLLRGVNVGGRVVKMAELKACIEELDGISNVKTLLQSGNVVLQSDETEADLKDGLKTAITARFNYPAKLMIYERHQLSRIIDQYPYDDSDKTRQCYIVFLENGLETDLLGEAAPIMNEDESFSPGDGVVYWQVVVGMSIKSPFSKLLAKSKYKDFNTVRNIRTLRKLIG